MTLAPSKIPADDFRAAIAHPGIPANIIAARVRIYPIQLSRILRRHVRITDSLVTKILLAVQQETYPRDKRKPQ